MPAKPLLVLTPENKAFFQDLVKKGILVPPEKHRFPELHVDGTILITCSDCDQFPDIFQRHQDTCGNRCHPLSCNGGPLLLSPTLTDERAMDRKKWIDTDLPEAIKMKGIHTVALYWCKTSTERTVRQATEVRVFFFTSTGEMERKTPTGLG
jgi:hypothetical protein